MASTAPGHNDAVPPPGLCSLVASYAGRCQPSVPFPADSWRRALDGSRPGITRFLRDDRYTRPDGNGRRTVTRAAIRCVCADIDRQNPDDVLAAFILVMAWGNGTRAAFRGIPNTKRAMSHPGVHEVLANAAQALRGDYSIERAYTDFSLPGIGQAFFTKWFAFAGYLPGRPWQPLILDSRVYRTLNETLRVTTIDMAGTNLWAARYLAYVGHMHDWAQFITSNGCCAVDAERLEWIFFAHNGEPLPQACKAQTQPPCPGSLSQPPCCTLGEPLPRLGAGDH